MTDGHAVLIARLSANDQRAALKYVTGPYSPSISELKDHIDREFYKPMEFQPWLKDSAALLAVGPCKECPPNVPSLFGAVKEGACTDRKCWKRKMGKYIDYRKEKDPDLVLISKEYSYSVSGEDKDDRKGVITANNYTNVGPKDKCTKAVLALVAKGQGLGSQIRICVATDCKVHGKRHSASSRSLTPAEKAKREKEAAAAKAKEEKRKATERQEIADALKKVKWPITRKTLDVLFESALEDPRDLEEILIRRNIVIPQREGGYNDEEKGIRKAAEKMSDVELARLVVELAVMNTWNIDTQKKRIKML